MPKKYLFYVNQNYSFEILRPLQAEIIEQGHDIAWFSEGSEINNSLFHPDEIRLLTVKDAVNFHPDACFIPGNEIPSFIAGLKVQVFHGLEWKKKGHFGIRGYFDLYCTHGNATTSRFNALAEQHGYFDVIETGWPKLDKLFTSKAFTSPYLKKSTKPVILFAPTFSPSLTAAPALLPEIKRLIEADKYHWLIKFHPKMDKDWIKQYQALVGDYCQIIETADISGLLQAADIMVSDTSSVIGEFALLGKAIVTLNNSEPGDYLIDIQQAQALDAAMSAALNPSAALLKHIAEYAQDLHPYKDGLSAQRILAAVETTLKNGKQHKKQKPLNIFRSLKIRKKLNYWHF
ncbi:MAG: CDP-glycerol glycerophosphotransferase family protein [Thalassotalea sp.]